MQILKSIRFAPDSDLPQDFENLAADSDSESDSSEDEAAADEVKMDSCFEQWKAQPLFPNSAHSVFVAVFKLLSLQARHPLTASETMKDVWMTFSNLLPDGHALPSFESAKKMIKSRDRRFTEYQFCPEKCSLYYGSSLEAKACPVCNRPRPPTSDPNTVCAETITDSDWLQAFSVLFCSGPIARDVGQSNNCTSHEFACSRSIPTCQFTHSIGL